MIPSDAALPGRLTAHVAEAIARDRRRIIVTGAGGWLGMATLELLEQALGPTFAQRVLAFGSSERTLRLRSGTEVEQSSLAGLRALKPAAAVLLHLAFPGKERADVTPAADYDAQTHTLMRDVLAAADRIGVEAMFFASSGAATRATDAEASPGMRLYGGAKLRAEAATADWAERRGARAVIARIYSLSGPYMNKAEGYALAQFIADALARRPIVVRAPRRVFRSYVAIRELMSLVFAELLGPGGAEYFDSGGEPLELSEVAEAVAFALGGGSVERASIREPREDCYFGDSVGYARRLADHAIIGVPLTCQIMETAAWLGA